MDLGDSIWRIFIEDQGQVTRVDTPPHELLVRTLNDQILECILSSNKSSKSRSLLAYFLDIFQVFFRSPFCKSFLTSHLGLSSVLSTVFIEDSEQGSVSHCRSTKYFVAKNWRYVTRPKVEKSNYTSKIIFLQLSLLCHPYLDFKGKSYLYARKCGYDITCYLASPAIFSQQLLIFQLEQNQIVLLLQLAAPTENICIRGINRNVRCICISASIHKKEVKN